jgi:hypothetical protein
MISKQVHLNDPQLELIIVQAQIQLLLAGRAMGKTHGAGGPFVARNVESMPRGNHYIASSTYEKVLNDVLPKLQKGWEEMGYRENVHYWVRRFAPKQLRIPKPHLAPTIPNYFIHWANGAGNPLISADRPSLFVGKDGDSVYGDELRLWKKDIFEQLRLNIRGNVDKFGHLSNHLSELYTTDLPRDRKGDWVFDFEDKVDPDKIQAITQAQQRIFDLRSQVPKCRTKKAAREIYNTIEKYEALCNSLRRELVHVIYASSLENVHVLGLDLLWKWKKTMSAESFAISVLTIRQKNYGQFFYSMFNQDDHCYTASNYEVIDELATNDYHSAPWSLTQTDVVRDKPLEIAGDFNAAIIWLVVGQMLPGRLNITGSLWLKKPKKVRHLAKLFDNHYGQKKKNNNKVVFHYDQTAKPENAINDDTYIKEWVKQLSDLGWHVTQNYFGAAPWHENKHALWERVCDHRDLSTPNLYVNKNTNADLIKSVEDAPVRHTDKGFKKSKLSENSETIQSEHATHGSEALDNLIWGCVEKSNQFTFISTLTGV